MSSKANHGFPTENEEWFSEAVSVVGEVIGFGDLKRIMVIWAFYI